MTHRRQGRTGHDALDLIEEAVHLLRRAPAGAWLAYGAGAAPFVLALLYFWADMSRGAFADRRCLPAALGLALLFIWMRTWQSVFAVRLREQVTGHSAGLWTWRRWVRLAVVQAALQPTSCLLLPIILVPVFPFYQTATVVADDAGGSVGRTFRESVRLARLWPGQSLAVFAALAGFGVVVFFNFLVAIILVPSLLKSLGGVESAFTLSAWAAVNTTLLAAALGLTYLALDPLLRAVCVLRCFYGGSLITGEDLRVELRTFAAGARAAAKVVLALLFVLGSPGPLSAAEPVPVTAPAASPAPADLDRAFDKVLDRAEYNWRLPRERSPKTGSEDGWRAKLETMLKDMLRWIRDTLSEIWDWLEKFFRPKPRVPRGPADPFAWLYSMQVLVFMLLAVVLSVLAVLLMRAWQRRVRAEAVNAEGVTAVPDLRDENVGADRLPEDGWLRLARELMSRGELRLAMRALYLASLAHLARRELVKLAKFKSNRDYERELRRRARALPAVLEAFTENVTAFDRAWYGLHEVSREALGQFEVNFERIKAGQT